MKTSRENIFIVLCSVFVVVYAINNRYIYLGPGLALDQWTKRSIYCSPNKAPRIGPKPSSLISQHTVTTPNANLLWLYNTLTEKGINLGTIEETAEAISSDESNRRWLYETGKNSGINIGSYEEFEQAMGLPKFQPTADQEMPIIYTIEGRELEITPDKIDAFERDAQPYAKDITVDYEIDGEIYAIPLSEREAILKAYPNAKLYKNKS